MADINDFKRRKNVFAFIEHQNGELLDSSLELLGDGKDLANSLNEELHAVLLGTDVTKFAEILAGYGVSKVYIVEHPLLAQYSNDSYVKVLAGLIGQYCPSIFIFASTSTTSELVPMLAGRVRTGFVTDCISLSINNEKRLVVTRPIYRDKLYTRLEFSAVSGTQIIAIRPGRGIDEPDKSASVEIVRVDVPLEEEDLRTRIIDFVKGDPASISLTEAEIIISVGRGIGGPENLKAIQELAKAIKGSLGGTRQALDNGLIPRERLIGQTGKTVSPKLYFSCGISGAIQHIAGMRYSKNIVAINTDREAPIFSISTMGVLGDVNEIVPIVTRYLNERQASQLQ